MKIDGEWDRISIARLDSAQIVQTFVRPQRPGRPTVLQDAFRAPNGDLLVYVTGPLAASAGGGQWRDTRTGVSFSGGSDAQVSPDGTRLATLVSSHSRQVLRQYNFTSGRVLNQLPTDYGPSDYASAIGFGWTPDSRSLVVSINPHILTRGPHKGLTDNGGLIIVGRDAHELPANRVVEGSRDDSGFFYAYGWPAMLANGRVLAFKYKYPDQHDAWPSTLVEFDLSTNTERAIGPVPIEGAMSIDPHVNEALISGSETIWLYDGHALRAITRTASGHW